MGAAAPRVRAQASGGAREDAHPALVDRDPLTPDGAALRLGESREAELAHVAVTLELVHQLAGKRHTPAARAAIQTLPERADALAKEKRGDLGGHETTDSTAPEGLLCASIRPFVEQMGR